MNHIVSFSGGKDSTAMLHLLIKQGLHVDKLLYFETEWDFPQMQAHLDLVTENTGIPVTKVRYYRYFNEMLALWGWPKSAGGWCTARKNHTCLRYIRTVKDEKIEYVGFSADEIKRTRSKWMTSRKWPVEFPLIGANMGEADSLAYCRSLGYHWDGLYDVFDRVSCFCCPKGGKRKREQVKTNYPDLWEEWLRLDEIAAQAAARARGVTYD